MIVASSLYAMPLYVFTLLAIVSNESRKKRIASASVKKSRCRLAVGDHSTYWSIPPTGVPVIRERPYDLQPARAGLIHDEVHPAEDVFVPDPGSGLRRRRRAVGWVEWIFAVPSRVIKKVLAGGNGTGTVVAAHLYRVSFRDRVRPHSDDFQTVLHGLVHEPHHVLAAGERQVAERRRRVRRCFQHLPLVPPRERERLPAEFKQRAVRANEVVSREARRRARLVADVARGVERVVRAAVLDRAERRDVVVQELPRGGGRRRGGEGRRGGGGGRRERERGGRRRGEEEERARARDRHRGGERAARGGEGRGRERGRACARASTCAEEGTLS